MTETDKDSKNIDEALTSISQRPDPRLVSFARLLASRAAERDFARYLEHSGKAQNSKPEGK